MERTLTLETLKKVGKKVRLCGWVNTRRDHGKLVFVDLRDRSGIVQLVGGKELGDLISEDVIEVIGTVKKRTPQTINPKIPTGELEIKVEKIKVLVKAESLPFEIQGDGREVNEELRLKYRYLDLRRQRLVKNLKLRHRVIKFIRDFLDAYGFIEIETPLLTKATPEGARDFLVPSRLQPGKFYALPQSPQQYKQLLMVAGFEKYYQIARCLRDEDLRADRQLEFTQLDLEMSFVSQKEILDLFEKLYIQIVEELTDLKIWKKPFPRLTWKESMEKYGTDKPDLRPDKKDKRVLAFAFVVDFPLFEWSAEQGCWTPSHHPFTAPKDEDIPLLAKDPGKVKSWQYDFVCNGIEIGGGSLRITDPKIQTKIFEILGLKEKEIQEKFGHLLEAFQYGVPPHGGMATGIDRLLELLTGEKNIREVIAFPVTSSGQTAVMNAPAEIEKIQLKELGIQINKNAQRKT